MSICTNEIIELLKKALFDEKADFWKIMAQIKRELENEQINTFTGKRNSKNNRKNKQAKGKAER